MCLILLNNQIIQDFMKRKSNSYTKNETKSVFIAELFWIKVLDVLIYLKSNELGKKAKEINKIVKNIAHEEYKNMLFEKKEMRDNIIKKSNSHQLGTYEVNKISLLCFDDKGYILDDGIKTLSYEHKGIINYFD